MNPKSGKTVDKVVQAEEAASQTVVLPDESDQIIDQLKNQLSDLQGKLAQYKNRAAQAETAQQESEAARQSEAAEAKWSRELAPRLTGRLQVPAQELTARLEKLIGQVTDPELKGELEKCRKTAFYLFDTFREITQHHRLLTESLTLTRSVMKTQALAAEMEDELRKAGLNVAVNASGGLPDSMRLVGKAAVTVALILSRVAKEIMGANLSVELDGGEDGNGGKQLRLIIHSDWNWTANRSLPDVSTVVFRPGINATSVVDWLYVEKIIELQQGSMAFHRKEGKAAGFEICLPYTD